MTDTFFKKYKILEKIGEGSFSEVVKCEDRNTGGCYAAKRLKKDFRSLADVSDCAEIIAMQKLDRHPNVLYMIEFHYEPNPGKVIFIFELMDMSMYDFLKIRKRCIPELRVKNYLYQILKGIDHLHTNGLFHRDIKPENILIRINVSPYTNKQEDVKLADLGSIRGVFSRQPYTEYISTRWYRSPECLLTVGHYGPKMDIWAAGCVFYEMLTLKPLFPGDNELDQLTKIHNILGTPTVRMLSKYGKHKSRNYMYFPKYVGIGLKVVLPNISEDGQNLLKMMIAYDPEVRSNVKRLLEHRYFALLRETDCGYKYPKISSFLPPTPGKKPQGDWEGTKSLVVSPSSASKNKYRNTLSRASQPIKTEAKHKLHASSSPLLKPTRSANHLEKGPQNPQQSIGDFRPGKPQLERMQASNKILVDLRTTYKNKSNASSPRKLELKPTNRSVKRKHPSTGPSPARSPGVVANLSASEVLKPDKPVNKCASSPLTNRIPALHLDKKDNAINIKKSYRKTEKKNSGGLSSVAKRQSAPIQQKHSTPSPKKYQSKSFVLPRETPNSGKLATIEEVPKKKPCFKEHGKTGVLKERLQKNVHQKT